MKNTRFLILFLILLPFGSIAQSKEKDTLFFKFKQNYILKAKDGSGDFLLKDSHDDGMFYFEKKENYYNLKPKELLCLKKYVRKSKYYRKTFYRKLEDYSLYRHLDNYVIFLVRGDNFIHVESSFEIE